MTESEEGRTIPYEALVNALFENYESICDLDLERLDIASIAKARRAIV